MFVPTMADDRWEPDTLFFYFEWDFRFTAVETERYFVVGRDLLPICDETAAPQGSEDVEPSATSSAAQPQPFPHEDVEPSATSEPSAASGYFEPLKQGHFYEIPSRLLSGGRKQPSRFAVDLVRMCNEASRCGKGNIVWLSYQVGHAGSNPSRKTKLSFGTAALAFTRDGAAALQAAFDSGDLVKGHIDLKLKSWLYNHQTAVGAAMVWPPVGATIDHESACDPSKFGEGQRRAPLWETKWVCPGTRQSDDPSQRERWLIAIKDHGPVDYHVKLTVGDDVAFNWRTFFDVTAAADADSEDDWGADWSSNTAKVQVAKTARPPTKRARRELRSSRTTVKHRTRTKARDQVLS